MIEPEFLEPDVVLFLHDQALREFGGTVGVRDEGLLQSALARPVGRHAYAEMGVDLFDLAAAYAYGIAASHAFYDGNKRTGWASCVLFLRINHIQLTIGTSEVVNQIIRLVEGQLDEAGFAEWLRCRVSSPDRTSPT